MDRLFFCHFLSSVIKTKNGKRGTFTILVFTFQNENPATHKYSFSLPLTHFPLIYQQTVVCVATPMINSHLCHQSPCGSNTKSTILLFLFQESMLGNKTQILPNDITQKSPFFSFCTWDCWDYAAYFWKQITASYLMERVWHSFYFSDLAGTKIWWAPTTIF